jgi:uncharacterized protein (DUF885 family)
MYNAYVKEYLHLFPTENDVLRLDKYKYLQKYYENDISPIHIEKQKKLYLKYLSLLNDQSKTHFNEIFEYYLKDGLEKLKYKFHLLPLSHYRNYFISFSENIQGHGFFVFENINDYYDFMSKIKEFSIYVNQSIHNMTQGINQNIVQPKLIMKLVKQQLHDIIDNKRFINNNVPECIKNKWNNIIDTYYVKSVKKMIQFLDNKYIPKCRDSIGMYKDMYKYLVKHYTTTDLSPEKIHIIGLKEVIRIRKELANYDYIKVINNKDNYFTNENDILNAYNKAKSDIKNKYMSKYFYNNYKTDYKIELAPKYRQKYSTAYYKPLSRNGKRQGKFILNPKLKKQKFDVMPLTMHEGLPGHHLSALISVNRHPIQSLIHFTAYHEGWAHYCENLVDKNNKLQYIGKLKMELSRAIRLVVDTGIHYYDWSFDKVKQYMQINYPFSKNNTISINRYISIPGQALSYKMGEMKIKTIVNSFSNIKDGHQFILDNGPCPLSILEKKAFNNNYLLYGIIIIIVFIIYKIKL